MTVSGRFFPAQVTELVNLLILVLQLIRHIVPVIPIDLGFNVKTARSDLSEKTVRQAAKKLKIARLIQLHAEVRCQMAMSRVYQICYGLKFYRLFHKLSK